MAIPAQPTRLVHLRQNEFAFGNESVHDVGGERRPRTIEVVINMVTYGLGHRYLVIDKGNNFSSPAYVDLATTDLREDSFSNDRILIMTEGALPANGSSNC